MMYEARHTYATLTLIAFIDGEEVRETADTTIADGIDDLRNVFEDLATDAINENTFGTIFGRAYGKQYELIDLCASSINGVLVLNSAECAGLDEFITIKADAQEAREREEQREQVRNYRRECL